MNRAVPIVLVLALFPRTFPGQVVTIDGLTLEEKANGTLIRIETDGPLDRDRLTAWSSEAGWFYVTVMNAAVDTTQPFPSPGAGMIRDVQAYQLTGQVQLSFRVSDTIDSFEIDVPPGGREVLVTLRSPPERSLATLDRAKSLNADEITVDRNAELQKTANGREFLSVALIVTGGTLTVAGLVESSGIEFFVGGGLLAAGYVLKRNSKRVVPGTGS
ncbi:MAG: hypothetical protein ACE5LH_06430 [Fidelibacterota bacterium]